MSFTAWVAVSTVPLWLVAIWLQRRRLAREAAAAKQAETGDCFFSVAAENSPDPLRDLRNGGAL